MSSTYSILFIFGIKVCVCLLTTDEGSGFWEPYLDRALEDQRIKIFLIGRCF